MAAPTTTETIEAVIISGPRKGEFIRVNDDEEPALSAEADALLDQAVQAARSMAQNAKAARLELEELVNEMRAARKKRDEPA